MTEKFLMAGYTPCRALPNTKTSSLGAKAHIKEAILNSMKHPIQLISDAQHQSLEQDLPVNTHLDGATVII